MTALSRKEGGGRKGERKGEKEGGREKGGKVRKKEGKGGGGRMVYHAQNIHWPLSLPECEFPTLSFLYPVKLIEHILLTHWVCEWSKQRLVTSPYHPPHTHLELDSIDLRSNTSLDELTVWCQLTFPSLPPEMLALFGFWSTVAHVFSARLFLLSLICLPLFISVLSYYRNAPAVSLWYSNFPPLTFLLMSSSPMTLNTICIWKMAHLSTPSPRPSAKFQVHMSTHVSDISTSIPTLPFKIDGSKTELILPPTPQYFLLL